MFKSYLLQNEQEWEKTSVQMSLAPLKLLTSSSSDSDQWYIVVDADVILKNFNYMNNMAAAGQYFIKHLPSFHLPSALPALRNPKSNYRYPCAFHEFTSVNHGTKRF